MARTFVAASSHRLERTSAPVTAYPCTFAAWFKPVSIVDGAYHAILSITKPPSGGSFLTLYQQNATVVAWATGSGAGAGATVSGVTAGAWHHGAAVFGSSTSRTAYLNGTAGSAETSSQPTISDMDTLVIGADHFSAAPAFFFNGDLAEVAIWNVALDAGELTALAKGFRPTMIRPASLVGYWPITGNESPELDRWTNRYDLTLTGSPAKSDHPRLYLATRAKAIGVGAITAPATPTNPSPSDLSTTALPTDTLTWAAPAASSYNVYFGTAASPPLVVTGQAAASYNPGTLASLTTYYWKIVAVNAAGSTTGPIWSFTTINPTKALMTIAGITPSMRISGLTIDDVINDKPNSCQFRVDGTAPTSGQDVQIGIGNLSTGLLFAGTAETVDQLYEGGKSVNLAWQVDCSDYTTLINRQLVRKRYGQQSATDIFLDLVTSYLTGFTVSHVVAGLPTVEGGIDFTDVPLGKAFTRLMARVGGYWKPEAKDLHAFIEEMSDLPDAVVPGLASLMTDPPVRVTVNRSQQATRVFVEGGGSAATAEVPAGSSALPVEDATWYQDSGGVVVSGPQRIQYSGKVVGGAGALVGTTVTPSNGPSLSGRATTGLGTGRYRYVSTFVTGAGEGLPSPFTEYITGGAVPRPGAAPSVAKAFGGNLTASGVYKWKYAYLTALGETLASDESTSLTMDELTAPALAPTALASFGSLNMNNGDHQYKYTFTNGAVQTVPSPASNVITTSNSSAKVARTGLSSPPVGFDRKFYRLPVAGGNYKAMPGPSDGFGSDNADFYFENFETANDSLLGAAAPSSSTAIYRSATLNVVASADGLVTGIRVYRTAANGSIFKKVADIANATGTYIDTLADGSLGSTELSSATAIYNAINLAGIAIGPTGTTQRKVYRTVVEGTSFLLLTTIANNTATTFADTTADGSLGAAAPVTDTSGLVAETGRVTAGSTALTVTSTAPFRSAGGWAFIGQLAVRYTGITGSTLSGIPSSGIGSLGTTVNYGVEVIAAHLLTGIPTSGTGAILYDILTGDDVNLLVQVDDTDAQGDLAAVDGSDGIIEHVIQDRRLSFAEAQAVGNAHLALFSQPITTIRYCSRDPKTRSGKTVHIDLPSQGILGDYVIQKVTIDQIGTAQNTYPRYIVEASSVRFSFEDVLRRLASAA